MRQLLSLKNPIKMGTGKYWLISEVEENVLGTGSPCVQEPRRDSWTTSAKPFQASCASQAVNPLQLSELFDSGLLSSVRRMQQWLCHGTVTSEAKRNSEKVVGTSYFELSTNFE